MVLISIYTLGVSFAFYYLKIEFISTTAVHSILGIVLDFFLVFRTNSAYDRWWEGRKAWGALVNNSRNLALKQTKHVPNAIALALYQEVNKLKKNNVIDAEQYRVLDNELVA